MSFPAEQDEKRKNEEFIFDRVERARKKCLNFLADTRSPKKLHQIDLIRRMQDVIEWETLLAEMWTRLEMDVRKGDPSFPLKSARTSDENWVAEHVFPAAVFLPEFLGKVNFF